MTVDTIALGERALLLAALWGFAWFWARFDRPVLGWGSIVLFLTGHWGWALVVALLWSGAESAHRRWMAKQRACGL